MAGRSSASLGCAPQTHARARIKWLIAGTQVFWGVIAIQGVVLIACALQHFLTAHSARTAIVGLLAFLAAICIVLTAIASALREVRMRGSMAGVVLFCLAWHQLQSPSCASPCLSMIAMQVPMLATSLSTQLPKAFTALAPQVLPEVLPKVLPSLLPQLLVLMNATLPDLLPSILPKVLPALLPQIIADSPQIVTQIIRDLPAILANVSDDAGSQQPAAVGAGTTPTSPAAGKLFTLSAPGLNAWACCMRTCIHIAQLPAGTMLTSCCACRQRQPAPHPERHQQHCISQPQGQAPAAAATPCHPATSCKVTSRQ